jgi:hypothetical protein
MQELPKETMAGVEATNDIPLLTVDEKRILTIYDRLEDLQLEIALLKAQGVLTQGDMISTPLSYMFLTHSDEPMNAADAISEEDLTKAQQELLEAKAAYQVRTNVIGNVLIANPILNAVHAGKNASVVER